MRRLFGLTLLFVCGLGGLLEMTMEALVAPPGQVTIYNVALPAGLGTHTVIQTTATEPPYAWWYLAVLSVGAFIGLLCLLWPQRRKGRLDGGWGDGEQVLPGDRGSSAIPSLILGGCLGAIFGAAVGAAVGSALTLDSSGSEELGGIAFVSGGMIGALSGGYFGILVGWRVGSRTRVVRK
jgi:hypothetical protein